MPWRDLQAEVDFGFQISDLSAEVYPPQAGRIADFPAKRRAGKMEGWLLFLYLRRIDRRQRRIYNAE